MPRPTPSEVEKFIDRMLANYDCETARLRFQLVMQGCSTGDISEVVSAREDHRAKRAAEIRDRISEQVYVD